ncbi:hypothetical protein [Microcoleus sp. bin38.metabat.b11b12b14.051]|uniref:hypothetical protein n=1 Tax=Microcoleus sp. bin38.metabat.b11b12b14.051 TaxID=2742709 RepID=UPI0025DA68B6|nr:hypothetical protein [Microcoleus sp. bin38.metabat.b11b12b14.051]
MLFPRNHQTLLVLADYPIGGQVLHFYYLRMGDADLKCWWCAIDQFARSLPATHPHSQSRSILDFRF